MEFNYEVMEEELTCPVCLELYADPLMLPCSHSMCKKCLEEILDNRISRGKPDGFQCPSCRKSVDLNKENMLSLPKNLALENIVIRYTEERSKSIRKSLAVDWPFGDLGISLTVSGQSSLDSVGNTETASKTNCELCDSSSSTLPSKAFWHCVQCDVAYCQTCFLKYHPNRGALARHQIQSPRERVSPEKSAQCGDHINEQATMFCDRCKVLVCHLCVCDGEGRHAGHKMLAPDTACTLVKAMAGRTKDQSDGLLASLLDKQTKIESYYIEIKELHKLSCSRIEQQYQRFIEDLMAALSQEKQLVLERMDDTRVRVSRQIESHRADNERCGRILADLSKGCQNVADEKTTAEILARASELQPLIVKMKRNRKEVGFLNKRYESMLKDKSPKLQLLSGTEQFRKRIDKLLSWFLDDGVSGGDSLVPHILTASLPGKSDLTPRIQNKYLTTWGFSSTTFSGEQIKRTCSWTVTIERNSGYWGDLQTGYLFGIGISNEILNSKDLVGLLSDSHGLVCNCGGISFAHGSKQITLTSLDSLPISITVSIKLEQPDVTVFTYKIASISEGRRISLVGHRILRDLVPKGAIYPVFTVSQRVKVLFPTYV